MTIKRYLPVPSPVLSEGPQTAYAIETPHGPYVQYEDYAQLETKFAHLEALCESLQSRWASRPLSHPDGEALEAENARLREALQDWIDAEDDQDRKFAREATRSVLNSGTSL